MRDKSEVAEEFERMARHCLHGLEEDAFTTISQDQIRPLDMKTLKQAEKLIIQPKTIFLVGQKQIEILIKNPSLAATPNTSEADIFLMGEPLFGRFQNIITDRGPRPYPSMCIEIKIKQGQTARAIMDTIVRLFGMRIYGRYRVEINKKEV